MNALPSHSVLSFFNCRQIRAKLAILPDSTVCGKPNAAMANMLRSVLLQVSWSSTKAARHGEAQLHVRMA